MNRSSGVDSLKQVVHLCMMMGGVEDFQLTGEIEEKIENVLHDDCRLTVDEHSAIFLQISRSQLHKTITKTFRYWKLSVRWVPKQLIDQRKFNRVEVRQEFLRCYKLHGDKFLHSIVTGNET